MSDVLKRLEGLKKKLEDLEKEKIKIESRSEQLLEQLKAMGINSLEEGRQQEQDLMKVIAEAEAEAERLISEFEEKYKEWL